MVAMFLPTGLASIFPNPSIRPTFGSDRASPLRHDIIVVLVFFLFSFLYNLLKFGLTDALLYILDKEITKYGYKLGGYFFMGLNLGKKMETWSKWKSDYLIS